MCDVPQCLDCPKCAEERRIENEIRKFESYSERKGWLQGDSYDFRAIDQINTGFSIEANDMPHDGSDALSTTICVQLEILSDTSSDAYERAAETLTAIAAECYAAAHGLPLAKAKEVA